MLVGLQGRRYLGQRRKASPIAVGTCEADKGHFCQEITQELFTVR